MHVVKPIPPWCENVIPFMVHGDSFKARNGNSDKHVFEMINRRACPMDSSNTRPDRFHSRHVPDLSNLLYLLRLFLSPYLQTSRSCIDLVVFLDLFVLYTNCYLPCGFLNI